MDGDLMDVVHNSQQKMLLF